MSDMSAVPPPEVVETFTSAAITALQELARVEASPEPVPSWADEATAGPMVSASIRLQRSLPGVMTLFLRAEVAARLAARYLPEGAISTEELIDDVAGEFANVIAGQAKTILKGTPYHFTLTTPVVSRALSFVPLPLVANAICRHSARLRTRQNARTH